MPTASSSGSATTLQPHLGQRVLEVGAGVGAIATKLAAAGHDVVAIEPADNVFPELQRRTAERRSRRGPPDHVAATAAARATRRHSTRSSTSACSNTSATTSASCARRYELLRPGGTLALFVPAMPSLYGSLDFKSGHFRRYDRSLLEQVVADAGFEISRLDYMDIAGVVPYFLMYRLLDVPTLGRRFVEGVRPR